MSTEHHPPQREGGCSALFGKWLPIESAPKMQKVLTWGVMNVRGEYFGMEEGNRQSHPCAHVMMLKKSGDWWSPSLPTHVQNSHRPQYWMPIPELPNVEVRDKP